MNNRNGIIKQCSPSVDYSVNIVRGLCSAEKCLAFVDFGGADGAFFKTTINR
jgi:hypothetical protein